MKLILLLISHLHFTSFLHLNITNVCVFEKSLEILFPTQFFLYTTKHFLLFLMLEYCTHFPDIYSSLNNILQIKSVIKFYGIVTYHLPNPTHIFRDAGVYGVVQRVKECKECLSRAPATDPPPLYFPLRAESRFVRRKSFVFSSFFHFFIYLVSLLLENSSFSQFLSHMCV